MTAIAVYLADGQKNYFWVEQRSMNCPEKVDGWYWMGSVRPIVRSN